MVMSFFERYEDDFLCGLTVANEIFSMCVVFCALLGFYDVVEINCKVREGNIEDDWVW